MDEEIKQDTAPEQLDETQNEDTKDIQSQNEENSNNIDEIKSNEGQEKKVHTNNTAPNRQPSRRRPLVGVEDKKVETKRIILFLLICFGVSWLIELVAITPLYKSDDVEMVKEALEMISQVLMTPAIAALIVRTITREGLVKSGFQFNFSEHKFLFLFGWFGTTILTFLGAVLYFIIFKDNFDPNMTNFVAAQAAAAGKEIDAVNTVAAYKTDLLISVFTAAVLDIVNAFGEEWGFRAYLLPKLFRKVGAVPAMILSGLASGLWYAPLVALGYYYGDGYGAFPIPGILAMCVFGMFTGIIYSFLCLRTGSICPSVFAHSALSVMMSKAALFTFDGGNYFVGPSPTGIVAGIPIIITAIICIVYMIKHPITPSTPKTNQA